MAVTFIKGKRTYILAGIIGLASFAKYLGYIDESLYQLIVGFCGAGAAATIRLGSKDDAQQVVETMEKEDCK